MSTVPPVLAHVLRDLELLARAQPRFEADARLIAGQRLRLAHQAATEAAILAEGWRHYGAADGFNRIARAFRAAAETLEAPVQVRLLQELPEETAP